MRTLLILAVAATTLGCSSGPAPPKRGALSGKITLDGKPALSATIRFIALDPSAVNVIAKVTNGEYSLPEGAGPAKGKYRVEFSVPSTTKRRIPNDDIPGQFIEEAPETLPPRYHRDSQITMDYDPANPQPFNYDLSSH